MDTLDVNIRSNILRNESKIAGTVANWFSEYLTNRHQLIHKKGVMSDKFQVEYSVPQVSAAEPLTFLLGLSFFYDVIEVCHSL